MSPHVAGLLERWEAVSAVLDGLVVETVEAVCAGPLDAHAAASLVHVLESVGRRSDQGRVLGARAADEADLAGAGAAGTGRGLPEFKGTADWFRYAERVSTAETNRRLLLSRTLLPRRALTGERL
ncbi:hypothetical protein, partial [Zhihengliuella alba]|uniref:hypothetical protein n=1 Tax=Zhihengliuella alba TaxID=547018 RepID=UPI0031E65A01